MSHRRYDVRTHNGIKSGQVLDFSDPFWNVRRLDLKHSLIGFFSGQRFKPINLSKSNHYPSLSGSGFISKNEAPAGYITEFYSNPLMGFERVFERAAVED